ncbi:hypothetical protein FGO85_09070 [Ligilactobacillus salivarius]|uniref:hypothetical protein n=1 Tax=Ligilactobacillus salivarius TaxID=1624 RepID=UPI0011C7CBF3|nr:hypothetical protein [Ligilactobacillus salivarius]TXJ75038.1 hypothetical protein FGO85_09070 [Ligilactobacillus salivarius]
MKAIDVFYLENKDISSVVVPGVSKFKIGDKIADENGTVYKVYSFEHICRCPSFKEITGLVVHGKFEGDIVNLVDEPKGVTNEN